MSVSSKDRFSLFEIYDVIKWLDFEGLTTFGLTKISHGKIVFTVITWVKLCERRGLIIPINLFSFMMLDYKKWKDLYFVLFRDKNYPFRDFRWGDAIDLRIVEFLSERSFDISGSGYKFALEVTPNKSTSSFLICSENFICTLEYQRYFMKWAIIIKLADSSRCLPNCNCSYRGQYTCVIFDYVVQGEFTGCYCFRILPFDVFWGETGDEPPVQILLYVSAVKGFRADPVESLVYT